MRITITYSKVTKELYGVYRGTRYIGEVRPTADGWVFRSAGLPAYQSPPAPSRLQAVAGWPGLADC